MNEAAKETPFENDLETDLNDVINRLEAEAEGDDDGVQEENPEIEAQTGKEEPVKDAQEEEEQPAAAETVEEQPQPETRYSAPPDWPKDTNYAELPEAAQAYIHQREVHVNQMLQNVAHERRMAQQFQQVVEPFKGLMAAEGVQDPLAAVHGLMNTTAQLAMGAPEQKARKIADLINHYRVDLEILDKTLAGQMPENPEQAKIEQLINQRLGGIEQRFQQMDQQRQYAM